MKENGLKNTQPKNHLTVMLPKDHPVVRALEQGETLSVTDDIVEEIVEHCEENNTKEFSCEVLYDYIEDYSVVDKVVKIITSKLKAKGISVGP